jgi:hypothetical protein
MSGAASCRSASTGVISSESAPEARHRRAQLAQELGELLDVLLEVRAALRGRLSHLGGARERPRDVAALARQRREDRVAVAGEVLQRLVLRGEDRQHAVDLLERRIGPADHGADVLAAAGDGRAELVDDQRQAFAVGQPQRVVDQVEVDRLLGVLHRQEVLALARPAVDLAQRGAAAAPRPRASGSARTRRTSRRSATAGG